MSRNPAPYPADAACRAGDRMGLAMFLYAFCSLLNGFQFQQTGGEKFRNRRMNMHCVLYNRIRRLRKHDVQQSLNDFIASGPENRSTEDLFGVRIDRDFDETLCLPLLNGRAHSAHRVFRSECRAPRLTYFLVRHAASAKRRICEQSVRLDSVSTRRWPALRRLSATIS